jgi:predicted peptidase
LVIALHGAGGSENMFFDSYGHGAIVELCRKRGWLLLAPRAEGGTTAASLAEMIESLSALYPVDRKHVFLVGHSMGAMQGVGHINRKPELFAGAALISGGGNLTAGTKNLPIFVGVGADDFAITMSRQLQSGLKKAQVETSEYHEYTDCEHLFAVQDALPDIFAFFDKIIRK